MGRLENIKMIVMCHKAAQIDNRAKAGADTVYINCKNCLTLFSYCNDTF